MNQVQIIRLLSSLGLCLAILPIAVYANPKAKENPNKLTVLTMQLSKVKWMEKPTPQDLKRKNAIAIWYSIRSSPNEDSLRWFTDGIASYPERMQQVIGDLSKLKQYAIPTKTSSKIMQIIFDDNTGIRLDYEALCGKVYVGNGWEYLGISEEGKIYSNTDRKGNQIPLTSQPECNKKSGKLTLATMQFNKVKWPQRKAELEDNATPGDLKEKKAIAIWLGLITNDLTGYPIYCLTNPEKIQRIIDALLQYKAVNNHGRPFLSEMQIVFDDNTGIRLGYFESTDYKTIIGNGWESRESYKVWTDIFPITKVHGPIPLEKMLEYRRQHPEGFNTEPLGPEG